MKYTVKGIGEVELAQRDFIAKGGEGSVYGKGNVAYKIYEDPATMMPMAKIQELSVLNHKHIIKPERIILDKRNVPCGYTMQWVQSNIALCQLFTKAYRQRNNIDNDQILTLVKDLHELVSFIHSKGILVVDLNELNFLVDEKYRWLYAIDVNSYQTPSFPATVIMPSVRDRHCHNRMTIETDWFSWGIVSFQMLIGIHPYKGSHPDFEKLAPDERMEARMTKNISCFNPKAGIPKVCQPFDVIPPALRQWYKAVFEDGKRVAPPKDFVSAVATVVAAVKQLVGSNLFEIKEIETYPAEIVAFYSQDGNRVVVTDKVAHIGSRQYTLPSNDVKFTFTPKLNRPIAVYLKDGALQVLDIQNQTPLPFAANASTLMECNGRVYAQNGTSVLELSFIELANTIQCVGKLVGQVLDLPGSTKVFDGVIIQNLLGRHYASLFPVSGRCHQVGFQELDEYQILDAKYENNVLVVIGAQRKTGRYDRFVMRFAPDYGSYDVRKTENITYSGINFTVSDAGIATLMTEDEKIEAFSNKKDAGTVKELDDPVIESDMKLSHDGAKIVFTRGNKLYGISLRK